MASIKSTGADGVRATTPRLGLLVLQPTPFCNINCSYCYLSDRTSTARMSLQILDLACRRVFESRLLGRELAFGISDPYQRFSGAGVVSADRTCSRRLTTEFPEVADDDRGAAPRMGSHVVPCSGRRGKDDRHLGGRAL